MEVGSFLNIIDPVRHFCVFCVICMDSVNNIRYVLSAGQIAQKSIKLVDLFLVSVIFWQLGMRSFFLAQQDFELNFKGCQLGIRKSLELGNFLFDIVQISFNFQLNLSSF